MNYKVNSSFVKKVIEIKDASTGYMTDPDELQAYISENITTDELIQQFSLSGFLSILEDAADYQGVELDLTYDTAQNIRDALVGIAASHASVYDIAVNTTLIIYSAASYLNLLALNNHDINAEVINGEVLGNDGDADLLEQVFSLKLVSKTAEVDLLKAAIDGTEEAEEIDNAIVVNFENLIAAYKTVTGVDLGFYDFTNIAIVLNGLEEETGRMLS